jgi:hypothetical protein
VRDLDAELAAWALVVENYSEDQPRGDDGKWTAGEEEYVAKGEEIYKENEYDKNGREIIPAPSKTVVPPMPASEHVWANERSEAIWPNSVDPTKWEKQGTHGVGPEVSVSKGVFADYPKQREDMLSGVHQALGDLNDHINDVLTKKGEQVRIGDPHDVDNMVGEQYSETLGAADENGHLVVDGTILDKTQSVKHIALHEMMHAFDFAANGPNGDWLSEDPKFRAISEKITDAIREGTIRGVNPEFESTSSSGLMETDFQTERFAELAAWYLDRANNGAKIQLGESNMSKIPGPIRAELVLWFRNQGMAPPQ